jgi:hypothetical protein
MEAKRLWRMMSGIVKSKMRMKRRKRRMMMMMMTKLEER